MSENGFSEYKRLFLATFEEIKRDQARIEGKVEQLLVSVAVLQVKAGLWGALGGLVTVASIILISSRKGR